MASSPNAIEIVVPDGYEFQSMDDEGNFRTVTGGKPVKISCECSVAGECMPVYVVYNEESKILQCGGSCLICIKKVNGATIVSGGFVEVPKTVRFAQNISSLPPAFEAMFHDQDTVDLIESFVDAAWGDAKSEEFAASGRQLMVPSGVALVGVNLRGHGLLVPVPQAYARTAGVATSSADCSCSDGECEFRKEALPGGGSIFYCTGGCTGVCTLSLTGMTRPVVKDIAVPR